ncbi:MAG: hypothetical protein ACQERS_01850 [Bacteroidota bacterium]
MDKLEFYILNPCSLLPALSAFTEASADRPVLRALCPVPETRNPNRGEAELAEGKLET